MWEPQGRLIASVSLEIREAKISDEQLNILCNSYESDVLNITRCDFEGNVIWDEIELTNELGTHYVDMDEWEGFTVVYWQAGYVGDIKAAILNPDGSLVDGIPENGLTICNEQHTQYFPRCVTDDNDNSIVAWKDFRGATLPQTGPGLYVQKLELSILPAQSDEITKGQIKMSNYPNPFTQTTRLSIDLPRGIDNAEIEIFNIRGQKVRTLAATRGNVDWNCRNESGNDVGAGIYLYRLKGDNIQNSKGRMILLK